MVIIYSFSLNNTIIKSSYQNKMRINILLIVIISVIIGESYSVLIPLESKWTGPWGRESVNYTLYYETDGYKVNLYLPWISKVGGSSTSIPFPIFCINKLPEKIVPYDIVTSPLLVINNSRKQIGSLIIKNGFMVIYSDPREGLFQDIGETGLLGSQSISYKLGSW